MKKSLSLDALKSGLSRSLTQNATGLMLPSTAPLASISQPERKVSQAQYHQKPTIYFPPDLAKVHEAMAFLMQNGRSVSFSQAVRVLIRRAELDEQSLLIDEEIRRQDKRKKPNLPVRTSHEPQL